MTPSKRFTSFSNNFEDVILHRIFGDRPQGVFVDVGAADPRMENDCKALYDQGWSGVNVEPNPSLFRALLEQRPRDRSFDCALGAFDGEQLYFEVEGTGLSTLDPVEAERCRGDGWTVQERTVRVRTLRSLLEEAAIAQVDFLKIDVEGWEEQVLRGNDWSRIRPSVIMVEATLPERPERRQTGIEPFLSGHGYRRAWFDGLNDFYVHGDFSGADDAFVLPPNVFDQFQSYRIVELETHARQLEASMAEAKRYGDSEHAALLRKQSDLHDAQEILLAEQQTNRAFRDSIEERSRCASLDHAAALADRDQGWSEERRVAAEALASTRARLAREEHALLDSRTDCRQLRASLALREQQCVAYAEVVEATHRDREELLILREHVSGLRHAMAVLERRAAEAESATERHRLTHGEAAAWISAIRRSTSWRLTLPLRVGGRTLIRLGRRVKRLS